ncbi:FAD-dependent oxidoreductase [Palaeococcus pacificus]|uniref:FAD-dependent oxidoreductase n=1 Tax=Palaeococcus pacificus TaxID=971279 RepID=UPI0006988F68|nr:FAD-dependent oxidoreductase [Palaeococcus pacificus]
MRPFDLYEKDPSKKVTIYFEGKPLEAYKGEPIAIALLANGIRWITLSGGGRKRGAFTFGPALVTINGVKNQDARKTKVKEGMKIEMQSYMEGLQEVPGAGGGVERHVADVVVIGGGPAGIGAALEIQEKLNVVIIEEKGALGGELRRRSTPIEGFGGKAPKMVKKELVEKLNRVKTFTGTTALGVIRDGDFFLVVAARGDKLFEITAKRVIIAVGAIPNYILFENNEMPGIFRQDFALEVINVWGVKPGNRIAVVGSHTQEIVRELENAELDFIVIEKPIVRAEGENSVEMVVDEDGNVYEVDSIIIAEGVRPDINLAQQVGAKIKYVEELGGYLPLRNSKNEVVDGIYIAGSASWVKGHYENYLEGRLVGAYILESFGIENRSKELKEEFLEHVKDKAALLEEVRL